MYDIDEPAALDELLGQLRTFRSDHQWVEAKRAKKGVPQNLWETLSGFANSDDGGVVLLGVHEAGGAFNVVGVDDPAMTLQTFQARCAEMTPALRPAIHLIDHDDGVVLAARIEPVPISQRPCHRASSGVYASCVRVGDGDHQMSRAEVDDLLASRPGTDDTLRPAPPGAALDGVAVDQLLQEARSRSRRLTEASDQVVLRRLQVVGEHGDPTLAGFLAVGEAPETSVPAARVTLQRPAGVAGGRFDVTRAEGRIAELLEQALQWLHVTLPTSQVPAADGRLMDVLELPPLALREIVANALLHRSFTEARVGQQVQVVVTDQTIKITSPGMVAAGTDLRDIGIRELSTPRNPALARLAEYVRTSDGGRVAEMVASGIPSADEACAERRLLPPLLSSKGGVFTATFDRRPLADGDLLVQAADRLSQLHQTELVDRTVKLDVPLAARLLQVAPDVAATELNGRSRRRQLQRRQLPVRAVWTPAEDVPSDVNLRLLAELADGPRGAAMLLEPLGYSSRASVTKLVNEALDEGLIEAHGALRSPNRTYSLTPAGRAALER